MNGPLLETANLTTSYHSDAGSVEAVRGIDFTIDRGEVVALVGESGSGKSATALSLLRLIPASAGQISGEVRLGDTNLVDLPEREMRAIRGADISMVFQDPMTSLNPVVTVGKQIRNVIMRHTDATRREAEERCVELLELVGLPDAKRRMSLFPHEFSGGMRQRIMIAMALSCEPSLLIADEPTTALDVTIQAQILELILSLRDRLEMSILLITHDLGVVARTADRVLVMKDGQIVERGTSHEVFYATKHAYTKRLLASVIDIREPRDDAGRIGVPSNGHPQTVQQNRPVLDIDNAVVSYPGTAGSWFNRGSARLRAVDGVSIRIGAGEVLGLVGESGCGKSTLARAIMDLVKVDEGTIEVLPGRPNRGDGGHRGEWVQMVFQDPYDSLNPRLRVNSIVAEPLAIQGGAGRSERDARVARMLEVVGLQSPDGGRFPHQFSGGQRQRIGIARALSSDPDLVICDEPVSALDVTVRAQILTLFRELRDELEVALLFIAHDLGVVRAISDRVAVMYLGKIVESGPVETVFDSPAHPYTQALIAAIPVADPKYERTRERIVLQGDVPSPVNPPSGCRFRTRCPYAQPYCAEVEPPLVDIGGRVAACHFWEEIRAGELQPTAQAPST